MSVTSEELRQFIEQWEAQEAEKRECADRQKDIMREAKVRGYDTTVMRMIITIRNKNPDVVAEQEAVLEMYKAALGMNA